MLNHMKNRGHVVTARETENDMLMRCAAAARSLTLAAQDQRDANVFRVAAMVVQSRLPREANRLMQVSEDYFLLHPTDRLPAVAVVRNDWVFSLPRLRDMLSLKLSKG
jgi:hypothetical protein